MVSWMGYSEQILRQNDESEEFEDVIAMSTLAFNKKQWKKNIGELLSRFRFSRFTVLQLIPAMILACLICVFYVSLCLLWSIVLLYLYLIYTKSSPLHWHCALALTGVFSMSWSFA
jgi:hypothetical protein